MIRQNYTTLLLLCLLITIINITRGEKPGSRPLPKPTTVTPKTHVSQLREKSKPNPSSKPTPTTRPIAQPQTPAGTLLGSLETDIDDDYEIQGFSSLPYGTSAGIGREYGLSVTDESDSDKDEPEKDEDDNETDDESESLLWELWEGSKSVTSVVFAGNDIYKKDGVSLKSLKDYANDALSYSKAIEIHKDDKDKISRKTDLSPEVKIAKILNHNQNINKTRDNLANTQFVVVQLLKLGADYAFPSLKENQSEKKQKTIDLAHAAIDHASAGAFLNKVITFLALKIKPDGETFHQHHLTGTLLAYTALATARDEYAKSESFEQLSKSRVGELARDAAEYVPFSEYVLPYAKEGATFALAALIGSLIGNRISAQPLVEEKSKH